MTFNSIEFLIFYPIVLLGYFASKRMPARIGENFRWLFLLITSYFFYMYYQPTLIVLILFTTVVSWISSLVIQKLNGRIETEQLTGILAGLAPDAEVTVVDGGQPVYPYLISCEP